MSDVRKTLAARGKNYGKFRDHACISQNLKSRVHCTGNWEKLTHAQKEALDMIMHKVARILNGNPDHADSWHDIAGYATLVEQQLNETNV